jgi:plastocyanin
MPAYSYGGYGSYGMPYGSGYGASQMPYVSSYGSGDGYNPYAPNAATQTDRTVALYDNYFQPSQITVAAGTTVRWVNSGRHQHTVTSDDGLWDSGELLSGSSYARTFTAPGTYPYHCAIHAGEMRGVVIVK